MLAANQDVMRQRLRVGFHDDRPFLQGWRPILLAAGNRLGDLRAEGLVPWKAFRQVVLTYLQGLGVGLQEGLLLGGSLILVGLHCFE
jgi:hypothetical protein